MCHLSREFNHSTHKLIVCKTAIRLGVLDMATGHELVWFLDLSSLKEKDLTSSNLKLRQWTANSFGSDCCMVVCLVKLGKVALIGQLLPHGSEMCTHSHTSGPRDLLKPCIGQGADSKFLTPMRQTVKSTLTTYS